MLDLWSSSWELSSAASGVMVMMKEKFLEMEASCLSLMTVSGASDWRVIARLPIRNPTASRVCGGTQHWKALMLQLHLEDGIQHRLG